MGEPLKAIRAACYEVRTPATIRNCHPGKVCLSSCARHSSCVRGQPHLRPQGAQEMREPQGSSNPASRQPRHCATMPLYPFRHHCGIRLSSIVSLHWVPSTSTLPVPLLPLSTATMTFVRPKYAPGHLISTRPLAFTVPVPRAVMTTPFLIVQRPAPCGA